LLDIRIDDDGTVFLAGRLDASQVEKAKQTLGGLNDSTVADFSGLEYISSAGIGVIMVTYKRLHDAGKTFKLVKMTDRIKNVFQYAGLDKVFMIE
jgi:anti-anti-sigma factor